MKTLLLIMACCLACQALSAQQPSALPAVTESVERVSFVLKNTLGYHRMFRVEGPGIAYGFTMNRRESVPCNWPIGAKLYFSADGETTNGQILTVTAADAGRTLTTDAPPSDHQPRLSDGPRRTEPERLMSVRLRNNRLMFSRVAIITYRPDESGNGTRIVQLAPYGSARLELPAGTRVYIADDRQVDTVMSGRRIDRETPFLIVRSTDSGRTFDIFE